MAPGLGPLQLNIVRACTDQVQVDRAAERVRQDSQLTLAPDAQRDAETKFYLDSQRRMFVVAAAETAGAAGHQHHVGPG